MLFWLLQINIAQGDFWFSSFFLLEDATETKPGVLCWGSDVGCKLRRQGPGSVCGGNARVQRVTQMLTARLFLEITEQNSWAHGAHIGHMEPQMEGSDKAQP